MKKLQNLKADLYLKKMDLKSTLNIQGGYTLTGCNRTLVAEDLYDCSDRDEDEQEA